MEPGGSVLPLAVEADKSGSRTRQWLVAGVVRRDGEPTTFGLPEAVGAHKRCQPDELLLAADTSKAKGRAFLLGPDYGWLRGLDLNQRPSGYEPDELPDCSTPHTHLS